MVRKISDSKESLPFSSAIPNSLLVTESPLLRTKLRSPNPTPSLLSRPRLNSLLHFQPNGYLTLLSAPAGFGKTTLVADWVHRQENPVAWLTLDEQDNDPVLFWRYVIAALQTVNERIGQRALAALAAVTKGSLETAVTLLINEIVECTLPDAPLCLVLDDFHWIHTASIHHSLNFLLQHQPAQLHLLLLTRADPPLSLARFRVEGRLLELRAADLRLTPEEISAFFAQILNLDISDANLQLLTEKTEGWPAGLQLVALTLNQQGTASVAHLAQLFARVKQHVFAYLLEEVLRYQTEEVRLFLQQTAVLRQFCASLCTAVTGQPNTAQILHQLITHNLFIMPLDEEGEWYRYHPLFAEMLRANLDEAAQHACHRQAAIWYAEHQMVQDAMRNALAAQDYALAADLLTRTYKTFLAHGLLVSLQKWLAALPPAHQSPRLRLATAWCRVYQSSKQELQQVFHEIDALLPEVDKPFQGEILALRAVYASLYGELANAVQWANEALMFIDEADYLSLAAAYQALGNAYRLQGALDDALAAYVFGQQQFAKMGDVFMRYLPLYRMASIHILQGRLHQAWHLYESIRQQAQAAGREPLIMTGELFGHLSDLYLEWNELEKALDYARQEIDLAQAGDMLLALVDGYLKLAAAEAALGNEATAQEALTLARGTAVQLNASSLLAQVALHQARHDLSWGKLAAASTWAEQFATQRLDESCLLTPLLFQSAELLSARIWLAQGHAQKSLELLESIAAPLEAWGRLRLIAEAHLLRALAWAGQQKASAAQNALCRALALAEPEGYIRLFVENGVPLLSLLNQVRHQFPDYVPQLLKAISTSAAAETATPLLDPLTERESEILELINQGQTNRQIAESLFISVGTVKGHVNHIFSKLDVNTRTQALVQARELGLVKL